MYIAFEHKQTLFKGLMIGIMFKKLDVDLHFFHLLMFKRNDLRGSVVSSDELIIDMV